MSSNVVPFRQSGDSVAQTLISRLSRVTACGKNRWRAVCPAHDSRQNSQTLSVRELNDGTILIKCFAGCGAADVVGAVGLELRDLFPASLQDRKSMPPRHYHASREAMQAIHREVLIGAIAAAHLAEGVALSGEDVDRVAVAAGRIRSAIEACL
jgi:hypothetical protein